MRGLKAGREAAQLAPSKPATRGRVSFAQQPDPLAVERAVCLGDTPAVVQAYAPLIDSPELSPEAAFALGRAFKEEDQFAPAQKLFARAMETSGSQTAARAEAHLAHLDYYGGDFMRGAERALHIARTEVGLARAEGALYASVNLIALNRSSEALSRAIEARNSAQRIPDELLRLDARFRIQRQLVHVYVARGEYRSAESAAEGASAIARRIDSPRHRGFSAYLHGYVAWARGDASALVYLREADREWGGTDRAFGRWLQYVWAMTLRDLGHARAAANLRAASGIQLGWEEPLFEISEGHEVGLPDAQRCPDDERPFRLATRGLLLLLRGQPAPAQEALADAVTEFERCELHHFRRGAALNLAAARIASGVPRSAAALLRSESVELERLAVQRWSWWHPQVAQRLAVFALENGIAANFWRRFATPKAVVPTYEDILRAIRLTEREVEVALTWLEHSTWGRTKLAAHLRMSEASLRNHLNRLRRKLACGAQRGPRALRARLEELAVRRARVLG